MKKYNLNTHLLYKLLLVFFILSSVFVKFYEIGYRSFFLDELYSLNAALEPDYNKFLENWVNYDSNPPLYYFFLRFWLKVFPATEFWVRLPSVLSIVLATFFFVNGIKKRFHSQEWFYLLILTGTSYAFLFFGQEARAYSFLLLFTCLQLVYFIDLIIFDAAKRSEIFLFKLSLFTLFSILSSYTHYTGIFFSGALFLILIVINHRNIYILKHILAAIIISIISGLFWVNQFLFILNLDKYFIVHQKFSIILNVASMLFFGNSGIGKFFTIIAMFLFSLLIYLSVKQIPKTSKIQKVISVLGLLSGITIAASPFIFYWYSYRHYIVFIPVILLYFSFLLSRSTITESKKGILMIIGIMILFSQAMTHYKSDREEWRHAVKYIVETNMNKKTKVIILGQPWEKSHKEYLSSNQEYLNLSVRRKPFYQYYFNRFDSGHNLELIVLKPDGKLVEKYVKKELKTEKGIFILSYTGGFSKDIKNLKFEFPIYKKDFYGHSVYYIKR